MSRLFRPVRKAVFPVGGLGTRFLPATKAVPKEMLPVVDTPLVQYAVDEARAAGIEDFIFVTAHGKAAIEDHFDTASELESQLRERNKPSELEALLATRLPAGAVSFTRQQEPLGLGHAIWCARHMIGDEPFAILLPDDFIHGGHALAEMVEQYEKVGGNLLAVQEVPDDQTQRYGIVTPGARDGTLTQVRGLVEKPARGTAPSNLAVIGRYILQPEIFDILGAQKRGAGNEVQLTDAMAELIGQQPFHGTTFTGTRHDCGDKAGHVIANIAVALDRPDIAPAVRAYLQGLKI